MPTLAASMDNFNYNGQGQEDFLYMPSMDLVGQTSAALKFDVAYARYSAGFLDGLRVELSTDCGASYTILYDKEGTDLATVTDKNQVWTPSAATDWRLEELDLDPYVGNTVIVRFVGVNVQLVGLGTLDRTRHHKQQILLDHILFHSLMLVLRMFH